MRGESEVPVDILGLHLSFHHRKEVSPIPPVAHFLDRHSLQIRGAQQERSLPLPCYAISLIHVMSNGY